MNSGSATIDPRLQTWLDQYGAKFGLSYHLNYALQAQDLVGFKGKRVLEVGGSLPAEFVLEELGVASWTGVEEITYYAEIDGRVPVPPDAPTLSEVTDPPRYMVARGRVEDLPQALRSRFDLVFSVAAFEHLDRFPRALRAMHDALTPGGKLFSMYSPIWSAPDGHHLHGVVDKKGRKFTFADSGIPPWGHLLMSPPQLYAHMLKMTDADAAAEIVYNVYHSPCINRLFTEDYADYIRGSAFKVIHLDGIYPTTVPPDTLAALKALYPTRRYFSNSGLMVVLEK